MTSTTSITANSNVATAPDQTEKAQHLITLWLGLDTEATSAMLARLIAACVHPGRGSALHEFAASGYLDRERCRQELNRASLPRKQEEWADALCRHLLLSYSDEADAP